MIIFISRDAIQQKDAPISVFFNMVMQAVYPEYCGDSGQCKRVFRQFVIDKFTDSQPFAILIPLTDGRSISLEMNVESFIPYFGEYDYMTIPVVAIIINKNMEIQKIRSFQMLEKRLCLPFSRIIETVLMFFEFFKFSYESIVEYFSKV
jgi:hypothetical protein